MAKLSKYFSFSVMICTVVLLGSFCGKSEKIIQNNNDFQELTGEYLGQPKPGNSPVKFAPGVVSTSKIAHSSPVFSPNGKEVFWSVILENSPGQVRHEILFSEIVGNKWIRPQEVSFASPAGESNPFFSIDGNKIYFRSERPLENGGSPARAIWVVTRSESGWSEPESLGYPFILTGLGTETSITADRTMYFVWSGADGLGLSDIYRSKYVNGEFTTPENLGSQINSSSYDGAPYISPDESYLIFSSMSRPDSYGTSDLYISFKKEDSSWTKSRNLGNTINGNGDTVFPYVSPDGKYFFFVSYRNNSQDVYWMDAQFIQNLKSEELEKI